MSPQSEKFLVEQSRKFLLTRGARLGMSEERMALNQKEREWLHQAKRKQITQRGGGRTENGTSGQDPRCGAAHFSVDRAEISCAVFLYLLLTSDKNRSLILSNFDRRLGWPAKSTCYRERLIFLS